MGLWSSIKKAVKKVGRVIKGAVRWAIKTVVAGLISVLNLWDVVFGFLNWPPKKLTLHIVVLSTLDPVKQVLGPICHPSKLDSSIEQLKRILKERCNVTLRPYSEGYIQVLDEQAPESALNPKCGWGALGQEFGEAGAYYADHLAGWVGIPISLRFPVTAFVVQDVQGKQGCSIGPLGDYIVIDMDGVNSIGALLNNSTLAHEIGHACNLWHSWGRSNLMFSDQDRGDNLRWFQRNLLRNSRHVTYW